MTMQVENLKEFVRCSRHGIRPESNLVRWLADCVDEVLTRRAASFEEAFGLQNCRGGVPWWMEYAMQERNEALRALAAHHLSDLSRYQQARKIETLSRRYMASAWRFDRNQSEMPVHYKNQPNEWLWRAVKTGAAMPLSQRQLRNIL